MKRIALIATVYGNPSTAQDIADRFLVGYPWKGAWRRPDMQVVSAYIDQRREADLSGARATEFGFTLYPSIAEALRCGGERLAIDAVLLVAADGDYPKNEKGQLLYPRYEFFKRCVEVFEKDGRAVPVYNYGHLSTSFGQAKWMVDASKRLRFPVLAGSTLPLTWRLPDLELPHGCEIEDALMVGAGESDTMDSQALEVMQCMIERRKGGETGVRSVQMIEGDAVWKAGEEGRWSKERLQSALSRSDTPMGLSQKDARTQDLATNGQLPVLATNPAAYFIEYRNGLKATLLMLTGALKDFNFAAQVRGLGPRSCQFLPTPIPNLNSSAALANKIEEMFETGRAPYPVERMLLVSGMIESCFGSRLRGHVRIETPHLDIRYQAPRESQHARA
jgi:hypothetical protein